MDISLNIQGFTSTVNIRTLRWEGQAGYPAGANLITCFLKSREPFPLWWEREDGGRAVRDSTWLTFKMEEEAGSHGEQAALRSWESKWTGSLLQEEWACLHLWLNCWGLYGTCDVQNCERVSVLFCLFFLLRTLW